MLGIAILLAFNLVGMLLKEALHIPLPANVIGLILFTAALFCKVVKLQWVEDSAQFLLRHMMVFFAPIIVGTMVFFPFIREQWFSILAGLVGSTAIALLTTAVVTRWLAGKGDELSEHESG